MEQQLIHEIRPEQFASDDATLEALADDRRRIALGCLPTSGEPVALADLVRDVASRESSGSLDEIDDDRLASVKLSLYHAHLPKLDDADLVAFDADDRTVERTATDLPVDL